MCQPLQQLAAVRQLRVEQGMQLACEAAQREGGSKLGQAGVAAPDAEGATGTLLRHLEGGGKIMCELIMSPVTDRFPVSELKPQRVLNAGRFTTYFCLNKSVDQLT